MTDTDANESVSEIIELQERLGALGYPPSLIKATYDPFTYAAGLRDGTVIQFHAAYEHGEWVTLEGPPEHSLGKSADGEYRYEPTGDAPVAGMPFDCPRGVDVRVADIVWCADAPEGS